jgi:hypothetical protein
MDWGKKPKCFATIWSTHAEGESGLAFAGRRTLVSVFAVVPSFAAGSVLTGRASFAAGSVFTGRASFAAGSVFVGRAAFAVVLIRAAGFAFLVGRIEPEGFFAAQLAVTILIKSLQ